MDLGEFRGRGRKGISNETVEQVTFDVIERESGSQYSASSAPAILCDLSLSWSIVRKILKSIIKWYQRNLSFVQQLNPPDSGKRLNFEPFFRLEYLLSMNGLRKFCGLMRHILRWVEQ